MRFLVRVSGQSIPDNRMENIDALSSITSETLQESPSITLTTFPKTDLPLRVYSVDASHISCTLFDNDSSSSPVSVVATTYTIGITEDIVAITGTLNTTLTLPDPSTKTIGETIYIVKEVAGTSVITINPFNTELISGNATYTFSDAYQSVRLYTNGTNWFII